MPRNLPTKNPRHISPSDVRAVARLATQATLGTTRIAEGVHQAVWRTMGAPKGTQPDQTRGLTALVYRCVAGVTRAVGGGIDMALRRLEPLLGAMDAAPTESDQRMAVVAALNGVMGDRLRADSNPLALPMTLRHNRLPLDPDAPAPASPVTGKILLLVHGLCMNDLQWQNWRTAADGSLHKGLDYGEAIAQAQGFTPVYLRYNTGLHVSENGQELSTLLERLIAAWPEPVQELVVVAHSMGGLVTRSAVHQAQSAGQRWTDRLKRIVFLGTPHHGAPLERAGSWIDQLLGATPYSAPFARLTGLRSSGITDLRHAYLTEGDWAGHDRLRRRGLVHQHVPLPAGVACLAVAAAVSGRRSALAERLLGDGLVPLRSALGQHDDPARSLAFDNRSQAVAFRTNHMQLLSDPALAERITAWLIETAPPGS